MDKTQIKKVLTGDFTGIDNFIENIIYPIFGEKSFEKKDVPEQLVTSESKAAADIANVSSILNIGTISNTRSVDIELFDVTLKNASDISRSRVGIQRLIRSALSQYSHAFIVFHYKDCENKEWRFSYLHKEDSLKNTTSAKRYTYVFGPEHNPRTATERFEALANSKKTDDDLTSAFSVEALSEEFFDKYESIYNKFVEYMIVTPSMQKSFKKVLAKYKSVEENEEEEEIYKAKYKPLRDYVKKLMGRLVFMYFLERKGWLNNDRKYMSKLFNDSSEKNDFLDKVLEPLFFGVLNTPRISRSATFKERGWDLKSVPGYSSIPYLNGGLFEQDELDKCDAKFPADYFEMLFSFFEEYNFTVDENDPNDEEMGIDPEMLSMIFESLLEDNKGKGAFYTPKEVVQSMCRESLITYLINKTGLKEASIRKLVENTSAEDFPEEIVKNKASIIQYIKNLKVCDPAIGSGAFPMGMLNLLVKVRLALCPAKTQNSNEIVELKKSIIQNNIYGVDIEKGAIDIARLRFWLSIVVDCKCDYENAEPLPNFDYKFMEGNSLVPTFDGNFVNLSSHNNKKAEGSLLSAGVIVNRNLHQLTECRKEFFSLFGKEKYRKEIEIKEITLDTLREIFEADLASVKASCPDVGRDIFNTISPKIEKEIEKNKVRQKEIRSILTKIGDIRSELNNPGLSLEERAKIDIHFFDYDLCFSEVMEKGGFDIVVGNPPYVSAVVSARTDEEKAVYKTHYPQATGSYDLYVLFLLLGNRLSKESCCWIIPNKFLINDYAKKTKELLIENGLKYSIDVSLFKVFKKAGVYPIIILQNKRGEELFTEYLLDEYYDLLTRNFKKKKKTAVNQTLKSLGIKVCAGATGFEAEKIKQFVSDKNDSNSIPFTVSGNIDRYCYNNKKVRYMKSTYAKAFVKLDDSIAVQKKQMWQNEKIIIAGMTKQIEATYVTEPLALGVGCYAIYDFNGFLPKFILGVLNSKYTTKYIMNEFRDKHLAGGYLALNKGNIELIPLPQATEKEQQRISNWVDEILENKRVDETFDTSQIERKIDEFVCSLYHLDEDEADSIINQ